MDRMSSEFWLKNRHSSALRTWERIRACPDCTLVLRRHLLVQQINKQCNL